MPINFYALARISAAKVLLNNLSNNSHLSCAPNFWFVCSNLFKWIKIKSSNCSIRLHVSIVKHFRNEFDRSESIYLFMVHVENFANCIYQWSNNLLKKNACQIKCANKSLERWLLDFILLSNLCCVTWISQLDKLSARATFD